MSLMSIGTRSSSGLALLFAFGGGGTHGVRGGPLALALLSRLDLARDFLDALFQLLRHYAATASLRYEAESLQLCFDFIETRLIIQHDLDHRFTFGLSYEAKRPRTGQRLNSIV